MDGMPVEQLAGGLLAACRLVGMPNSHSRLRTEGDVAAPGQGMSVLKIEASLVSSARLPPKFGTRDAGLHALSQPTSLAFVWRLHSFISPFTSRPDMAASFLIPT